MEESSWVFAVEEDELRENDLSVTFLRGIPILLVKKDGQIYALSNKCAHMGCPLSRGRLEGFIITCACHNWRFDIRTGEFLDAREIKISTYQWKKEDGKVLVKVG